MNNIVSLVKNEVLEEIDNYKKIVLLYSDAVERLYGNSIPADYLGENLAPVLQEKQSNLQNELAEIEKKFKTLQTDYITLIEETEREVNQYK